MSPVAKPPLRVDPRKVPYIGGMYRRVESPERQCCFHGALRSHIVTANR